MFSVACVRLSARAHSCAINPRSSVLTRVRAAAPSTRAPLSLHHSSHICPSLQGTREVTGYQEVDGKKVPIVGDFVWLTWEQVQAQVDDVGSGMKHFDLAKVDGDGVSGWLA